MTSELIAPFPWFGGKRRVASEVWSAMGKVDSYVEPFAGSLAVLLARPDDRWQTGAETVNDADAYLSNFWRALAADAEQVAHWADWPVNECVPRGTMIAAPGGRRTIEALRPGDIVFGYVDGALVPSIVKAVHMSSASELCSVGPLRLTANHPVWTARGYCAPPALHYGDTVAMILGNEREQRVEYLRLVRPAHGTAPLCGGDAPGCKPQNDRASIAGAVGRTDALQPLDSVPCEAGPATRPVHSRIRRRCSMAGARAILDCSLPAVRQPREFDGRRRRYARPQAVARTDSQIQGNNDWQEVSARSPLCHVGATSYAGGRRKDSRDVIGQAAYSGSLREDCQSRRGPGHVAVHRPLSGVSARCSIDTEAQSEDRRNHNKSKARYLPADRGNLPVHYGGGAALGSHGSVGCAVGSQGVPLQRTPLHLPSPITVYNIQTTTGNYFAAGILVHNCDLLARHLWLVNTGAERIAKMESDPDFYDAKVAGWWVWGLNQWIGSGWCSGNGPHMLIDGKVQDVRQLPHLGDAGRGVNRKLPHLGDAGQGVNRQLPHLGNAGRGVNRQLPHLGNRSNDKPGREENVDDLTAYFQSLAARLRRVRVCCGDWTRVVTDGALAYGDTVGVFLDPPYQGDVRAKDLYRVENYDISNAVREWAIKAGENPRYRIVLAGYEAEHQASMPASWRVIAYSANVAYQSAKANGSNSSNRHNERLWLSPHTRQMGDGPLFKERPCGAER